MKLVLVVEDEYGNAEILQLLLQSEGYRVAAASNGKAALELMETERPDVILSDFMMPIMNGGELGEAVRRNVSWAHIPFIFMSGTLEQVVRQAFRDYDAFVVKPFDVDTVLALVSRFAVKGRPLPPSSEDVGESMRHLLKGIHLPPQD